MNDIRDGEIDGVRQVDEFLDAVDSDDIARARSLMKAARIDASTIATVGAKIEDADSDH